MERTKLLTFAVIGLLLLNMLTIGFLIVRSNQLVHPNQPPRHPDLEGPAAIIIERLHFDEQQQQEFIEMARQHHATTQRLNAQSVRLFQAYYGLLTAAKPDSTESHSLIRQITAVQQQLAELNFTHFQEIRDLCRPDQRAYFNRLVSDLARLFGRPQRPPRPGNDRLTEDHSDAPPENFPLRP